MESSRSAAKESLLETIRLLEGKVPTVDFQAHITLNAVTPHIQTFETTFGREVND